MSKQTGDAAVAEPKKRRHLLPLAVIFVLLVILAAVYFAISQYYTDRFPAGTQINNINVGNLTASSVKRKMNAEAQKYTLTIQERNGVTETITAANIDLGYHDTGEVDALLAEYNPYYWPLNVINAEHLTAAADTVYDQQMAADFIAGLNCFDPTYVTPISDASLVLTDDGMTIQPEVEGTQLDQEKTTARLLEAVAAGDQTIDLEAEGLYLAPSIRSDDEKLLKQQETVNTWLGAEVTFDFGDKRVMKAGRDQVVEWMEENDKGEYTLNEDEVVEWVKKELAYKTDTFGLKHEFKTHSGETITLSGGDYGWCIARQDTAKKLIKAIKKGEVTTMEPEYQYKGKDRGINDIGKNYIEVDISDQKVYAYKDGKLFVETDVVTGCPTKGRDTPSGSVWAVDCHKSPATLGTMDTMGYSSRVNFWMSFNGNVGLHDADGWRTAYGGDIYIKNGSHGCVNMPYSAMEKIFKNYNIGDPVIVHQ